MRGSGHGLLCLGADEVGTALPPVLSYWRELGARYVAALCALPGVAEGATKQRVSIPEKNELDQIAAAVPPHRSTQSKASLACLLTAAPCAHVGGASHGTHDTTVRASPSR
jgi:hypothetical protein